MNRDANRNARVEPLRVLVADDEPLARRKLVDLIERSEGIECVGEAADGLAAIEATRSLAPDLLFLDVRMPGASGLEVISRLDPRPHVIFTTAYDRYAVAAFELQALDYLLKPFGEERFQRAVERAEAWIRTQQREVEPTPERARDALEVTSPLQRVFVRERGRIIPVSLKVVERLEAADDYVTIYTAKRKYLVSVRLRDFEARLDAERFLRVHRSHIVNLDYVAGFSSYDGTRLQIEMLDGTTLLASRLRSKELRARVM